MKIKGKIKDIQLDYITHKPLVIIQLDNQEDLLCEEFNKLQEEQQLEIEIKKHNERRSLNANSYCWVLIGKIAEKLGNTKDEVYREFIKDKGIYRVITIDNQAVNTFAKLWEEKGTGWLCETLNKGNTTTDLIAYYGSSSYNKKQMANFIDYVVQEAKELGIQTATPEEILRLKTMWGEQ